MNYQPEFYVECMVYILALWFLLSSFSGLKLKNIPLNVLFLWAFINVLWLSKIPFEIHTTEYLAAYIEKREFMIKLDSVFALILSMFLKVDNKAWKHALLLCFATLCHIMIILDLSMHSSFFSNFFYSWYDELIIMVGLLQMVISSDGITSAIRRIQDCMHRVSFYYRRYSKSLFAHKTSRERS